MLVTLRIALPHIAVASSLALASACSSSLASEGTDAGASTDATTSDMTALPDWPTRFAIVPRTRGQQLKEPAQLDGWLRDGSASFTDSLCEW